MVFRVKQSITFILIAFAALLSSNYVLAQKQDLLPVHKKFSVIAGFHFQNFAMPFRDMGSNFSHPGLFVGSEIYYNQKETLVQQVTLGGYLNREIGNGIHVSTQFGYRPRIYNGFYGELKAGVSYVRVFHATQAYEYNNGEWEKTIAGKSQLGVPFDFGLGYSFTTQLGEFSPFVSYQITPALFYNETLPVNIYTNILAGLRIRLSN